MFDRILNAIANDFGAIINTVFKTLLRERAVREAAASESVVLCFLRLFDSGQKMVERIICIVSVSSQWIHAFFLESSLI